jgi:hypothetical protein
MAAPKSKVLPKMLHLRAGWAFPVLKLKWERYDHDHFDSMTYPVYLWKGNGLEIAVERSEGEKQTWSGVVTLLGGRVEVLRTNPARDHLNAARALDSKLRKLEQGLAKFRGGK